MPVMSDGIRSGVNWMRLNVMSSDCASVLTMSVLARPGTPMSRACDRQKMAMSSWSRTCFLPDDDLADFLAEPLVGVAQFLEHLGVSGFRHSATRGTAFIAGGEGFPHLYRGLFAGPPNAEPRKIVTRAQRGEFRVSRDAEALRSGARAMPCPGHETSIADLTAPRFAAQSLRVAANRIRNAETGSAAYLGIDARRSDFPPRDRRQPGR